MTQLLSNPQATLLSCRLRTLKILGSNCCEQYCLPYAHISSLVLSTLGSSSLCSIATASGSFLLSLSTLPVCMDKATQSMLSQAALSPTSKAPPHCQLSHGHSSATPNKLDLTDSLPRYFVTILYLCLIFFACVGGSWGWGRDRSASTVNSRWDAPSNG